MYRKLTRRIVFVASLIMILSMVFSFNAIPAFSLSYNPMSLHFVKDYSLRNFFNAKILLNKLDLTENVLDQTKYPQIHLTSPGLAFGQNGQTLTISNATGSTQESYIKVGKLYHYAAIDMDVSAQNNVGYTANAAISLSQDASNRIVIVQRDNDAATKTFTVEIFKNGSSVLNQTLSTSGVAAPYTVRVHVTGRYLNFYRIKDGAWSFFASIDIGSYFDLRSDAIANNFSVLAGARLGNGESVSVTKCEQYLSNGTGQADPKVLHYENGTPIIEGNKVWLAMTTRGYDAIPASHQGIYSYDIGTGAWELTGDMSFDKGDGLKRQWHASEIFFDRSDRKWKLFTVSHGDDHRIYYGTCNKDPRFGITEVAVSAANYASVGNEEDPSVIYDAEVGKWRLAMCKNNNGYQTILWESGTWNGAYTQIASYAQTSCTGILIQKVGGQYYVFLGRGSANYEVLSYPGLVKQGTLNVANIVTDNNVWPVIIPFTGVTGTNYYMLTFDRAKVTGNYSYGNLYWYHASEFASDFYEYSGINYGSYFFDDNFNDGNANGWTTYGGTWTVNNGQYGVSSNPGAKSIVGGLTFSNFTYEADISVSNSNNAGLIFRVSNPATGSDAYNGYYVGLNASSDSVIIGKANGSWTQLQTASMTLDYNRIYHLKVVAQGSNIKVYVGDMNTAKISVTDTTYTSGAIGVRAYNNDARFDNICLNVQ